MADIPDTVTPAWAARQPLVLEHERSAVYALVMHWLAAELPLPFTPMQIGTVEAMKKGVAMGLGVALVPDVAVSDALPGVVVRPLDPPMPSTMALAEHRSKPDEPALAIVRQALLGLRTMPQAALDAPPPVGPRQIRLVMPTPIGRNQPPHVPPPTACNHTVTPCALSAAARKPVTRRVQLSS
jgi:DNA-binding transcriptional LysR family regulator